MKLVNTSASAGYKSVEIQYRCGSFCELFRRILCPLDGEDKFLDALLCCRRALWNIGGVELIEDLDSLGRVRDDRIPRELRRRLNVVKGFGRGGDSSLEVATHGVSPGLR